MEFSVEMNEDINIHIYTHKLTYTATEKFTSIYSIIVGFKTFALKTQTRRVPLRR